MKELEIIKNADIQGDTAEANVYRELRNLIEEKTDLYRSPENLSDEKIDMTETIKRYGYDVKEYEKMFGSTMRSEVDVVKHLAQILGGKANGDDIAKKKKLLLLAKAKIKIAQAKAKMN